ncbi:hypothetical protein SAMN05518863_10510 [Candidatus Pantoea symbiotica]|jgi:hypothetical protein|uniref:Uncharacterized protein n=1 Tax=Candidatus Pantoea symbiotica TaxID=1884370 RepID=A0A1I3XB73_9GAMM|nr:hypothetical protein SAMN05518863_10510 [Pantoea symbiotica]SFU78646.1 hypothetical protein SAMN05518864_10510 [Pantoea sp. YR525]
MAGFLLFCVLKKMPVSHGHLPPHQI